MNLEVGWQMLVNVNKFANFEFHIKKFAIRISFIVVYKNMSTNYRKFKMNPEVSFQRVL